MLQITMWRWLRQLLLKSDSTATARASLAPVYEYFRHYDQHSYEVFACQGNEPSEVDLAQFERANGFRLPDSFREFTKSGLGGLYFGVREEMWPRPEAYTIGPFWSFLFGIKVFGIAKDIPEMLDIRKQWSQFREAGIPDLCPFLQVMSDADAYCFDARGAIIAWSHEEPEKRRRVELDFPSLLMREIWELENRKAMKLRGEDTRRT